VNNTTIITPWFFPLANLSQPNCPGIPTIGHPGSFLHKRKKHIHTGVDLYTLDQQPVYAVEPGHVVGIEQFTGHKLATPWWEDTQCILIEGNTGVVCYGEINPVPIKIGSKVQRGQLIGQVKRVLKPGKERQDIEGHSLSMLHVELYQHGTRKAFDELSPLSDWSVLLNPTPYLIQAEYSPATLLAQKPA
jgi:murein DD-endopeptidase MepM/ murein hydrolase activator NlpD